MAGRLSDVRRRLADVRTAAALLIHGTRWVAGALVLVAAVEGLAPAISAVGLRGLLNGLIAHDRASVGLATAAVVVGFLLLSFLMPVTTYLTTEADRRIELVVSDRLFAAINAVPTMDQLEQPAFLDRIRLAQQAGLQAPQQLAQSAVTAVRGGITLIGFAVALLALDVRIAVLAVLAVGPGTLISVRVSARRAAAEMALSPGRRRAFFYTMMQTDLRAAKEIRLFGLGDYLRQQMAAVLGGVVEAERRRDRGVLGWQLAVQIAGLIFFAGAIALASRDVWIGRLRTGDVALVLAALAGIQASVAAINAALGQLTSTMTVFASYREVVPDQAPVPVRPVPVRAGSSRRLPRLARAVSLRDVWFRYDETGPWVLRGLDLELPLGTATALVGVNGAGKSTLAKLLCGLYRPTRGDICWDGRPVGPDELVEYRQHFSAVFQDFMTYDLTARQNIELGDLSRQGDDAAVTRAAASAGMHEVLAGLPSGYETMLSRVFFSAEGERGASLSGGQWQRLAIARALLRSESDVLILDEPSSGLDAEAEQQLIATLRGLRRQQTSLMISHRLNSIVDVDTIVVLADGVVVEQGDHRQLLAAGGRYAELFELQASGYRGEVAR